MDFTREQSQAIFTRDQDILVSAGAGAGKTRVLVTRISEMILDKTRPVSADQILVLTFTKAAAKEMKERITKELADRLAKNPEDRHLRQQIRVVKHADISNVHSFCGHLLRTNFNELGIDPAFRIGEEGELTIMRKQAMELLLEDRYQQASERFLSFVEAYAPDKKDDTIETMIELLYTFTKGFPDSTSWYQKMEKEFQDLCNEETMKDARVLKILLARARDKIKNLIPKAEYTKGFFGGEHEPIRFYEFFRREEEMVRSLLEAPDYLTFYDRIQEIQFESFLRAKKEEKDWPYIPEVKAFHEEAKKQIEKVRDTFFSRSLAQIRIDQRRLLPMFQELISLTSRYEEIYASMKKEKNVFDFNDLEHFTLQLLVDHYEEDDRAVPSDKAREIAARYKAIFVDEYQDTNMVQETIITVLQESGSCELFTVGDVKQSIYGFRQARPDLFLERYHRYEKGEGLKIELRDNFRSSPDVLDFCNLFFHRFMTEEFGGLDYDHDVELRAGENAPHANLHCDQEALFLLEETEEEDDDEENVDALTAEAAMIAKKIEELHEEGYGYEDIVILLRTAKNKASVIAEYLESQKIPAISESQMGYFQTREIRVITNYLSIIDNVYQDIPMASVLLSSIGGFQAQDLARIKTLVDLSVRKQFNLYDLMKLYLEEGQDVVLRNKLAAFLTRLEEFRQKKKEMLLHELIWDIYETTGFCEMVLSMPHGQKRRQNLMMLLQKAEEYEKTMFKGLFYFIRYIEQLKTYEINLGSASVEDSVEKAVKIMTIHKSKGLEFPVVFVSNISKKFNQQNLRELVLCHPVLGIGMDKIDLEERTKDPSVMKDAIKEQISKEFKEEELRLLYVAMTRAKEKLVLTGIVSEKKKDQIEGGDNQYSGEQADSFLDWILPVLYVDGQWKFSHFVDYSQVREWMGEGSDLEHPTLKQLLDDPRVADAPAGKVRESFGKAYPFAESIQWKRKYSVSELKKLSMQKLPEEEIPAWEVPDPEDEIPKPAFLQEKEEEESIRGTDYGTMIHKVMELLPFDQIHNKKELFDQLAILWEQFPQASEATRKKAYYGVENFLFSEYGQVFAGMEAEGRLYKELPFTIGLNSAQVYPGTAGGETVILQGIIDVCGEKDGELWLLDYKTDRIKAGEESLLLDRYKAQMLYYKLALEQMFEKKVSHSVIYSFALQKYIEISW